MSTPDINTALRIVCKELTHFGSFPKPIIKNGQPTPEAPATNILKMWKSIDAADAAVPSAEKRTWVFVNDLFGSIPWKFHLSPSDLTDGELVTIEDLVEQVVYSAYAG